MAAIVPIRPKYKRYSLSKEQQDCLTYYVLMGCTKQDAFLLFFPEFLKYDGSGRVLKGKLTKAGEQYCKQFFATAEVNDYIRDYKKTFEEKETDENTGEVDREKRANEAVQKFTDTVMDKMVGSFETVDEMDAVAKMADRVGMFEDKEKAEIRPVRVLPTRCKNECRYRLFVEGMKSEGKIFDDCDFCKARRYAEEHGFKYDPCTVLDVPQEVIDEIDSKNNVRLEDILKGKVEN